MPTLDAAMCSLVRSRPEEHKNLSVACRRRHETTCRDSFAAGSTDHQRGGRGDQCTCTAATKSARLLLAGRVCVEGSAKINLVERGVSYSRFVVEVDR